MRLASLLSAAFLATGTAAYADVTYSYTGQLYDIYSAPFTGAERVTGTFTLAGPLAPNLQGDQSTPVLSFSFSDGIDRVGPDTANFYTDFYTDSTGKLIGYDLESVFGDPQEAGDPYGIIDAYYFSSAVEPNGVAAGGEEATTLRLGIGASDRAGTLVESTTVTPKPGSFALLGTGLLGVGALARRRVLRG